MTAMFTKSNDVDYVFENFRIPKTIRISIFGFRKLNEDLLILENLTEEKHTYSHHVQIGLNLLSNGNTLIVEYFDLIRIRLG